MTMRYLFTMIMIYLILIILAIIPIWMLFTRFKAKNEEVRINNQIMNKKQDKVPKTVVLESKEIDNVESEVTPFKKNSYGQPLFIPKYNVEIEIGDISGVRFTDLNTGMIFGDRDVFGRDIVCESISYNASDERSRNGMVVVFTSDHGIVYQVLLHSFECQIVDIESINLNTVGATYCELYGKIIDEAFGREQIKLNIEQEKAEHDEFRVEGNQLVKYLGREQKKWTLSTFQEALLKMFQEIHKVDEYRKMMDISHGGFGGPLRKPRLSADELLKGSMVNSYALYKGATYRVSDSRDGLRLKKVDYDRYSPDLKTFRMDINRQCILVNQNDLDAYYNLTKHTTYHDIECAVCVEEDGLILLQGSNSKLKDYGFDFIEPAVYRKLVEKDRINVKVQRTDYFDKYVSE